VVVVLLVAGLALRSVRCGLKSIDGAVACIICWVAIGPVVVALMPPLNAYR
jgi:hypothetical protein